MRYRDLRCAAASFGRRAPPAHEAGFTLIELMLVVFIVGILILIILMSGRGFEDRAGDASASANVRAALPSVTAYFADHETYTGMTLAALSVYDRGLSATLSFENLSPTTFCVEDTVRGVTAHFPGPGGPVLEGAC